MAKAFNTLLDAEIQPDGSLRIKNLQTATVVDYPTPEQVQFSHMTVWTDSWQKSYERVEEEWVEITDAQSE